MRRQSNVSIVQLLVVVQSLVCAGVANAQQIKVACVGDSITAFPTGWCGHLGTKLGSGYMAKSFGVSGTTLLKDVGQPAFSSSSQYQPSHDFAPNIVVIMLGTNDSAPRNWDAGKDHFVTDYEELIDSYTSLATKPMVFLNTPPPASDDNMFTISGTTIENEINPLIKQVAMTKLCPLVDVWAAFGGDVDELGSFDGVHPGDEGQMTIAETVYQAIQSPNVPGGNAGSGGSGGSGGSASAGSGGMAGGSAGVGGSANAGGGGMAGGSAGATAAMSASGAGGGNASTGGSGGAGGSANVAGSPSFAGSGGATAVPVSSAPEASAPDSSGCACRMPGSSTRQRGAATMLLLVLGIALRRRTLAGALCVGLSSGCSQDPSVVADSTAQNAGGAAEQNTAGAAGTGRVTAVGEGAAGSMGTNPGPAGSGAAGSASPTGTAGTQGQPASGGSAAAGAGAGGSGGSSGAAAIAGAGGSAPVTCPATVMQPGEDTITVQVGGTARTFVLHVPQSYTGSTPVPLMLDWHGLGSSGAGQAFVSGYEALSDQEGFIIAWPNGIDQAWNIGPCCTTSRTVDDLAFARAIVDDVKERACIDPKRVYAGGYSMGGGMSHYLACNAADTFAAVAPSAFDLLPEDEEPCHPTRPITVILFRGTADPIVPYAGGASTPPNGLDVTIHFLGAEATFERWAALDGCTGTPTDTGGGCRSYAECEQGAAVTLCTAQGGSHDPGDPDVGWEMLKKHPMP